YGSLGLPPQPSNEHYENLLAVQWVSLDRDRPVWIEAESRRVGLCRVPDEIFFRMVESPVVQIERSRSERIAILLEVYGSADPEELIAATQRISKKLGGQNAQAAIAHIREGNLAPAIETVLDYYDKSYLYDLTKRQVSIYPIDVSGLSDSERVDRLIDKSREISLEKQVLSAQELVTTRK
ncbi:MAG: tRNA 2-selenouridine(34) synthase MnmH, partial [Phormidesmis sp. CAN_BIN44]|nr:tRNA 2-selenouridine(34) synthase MnmH [Phormidesmis sp. CAN_BIN44]